ncbi:unnamed protein product, partial [Pelagomonas calceolata]
NHRASRRVDGVEVDAKGAGPGNPISAQVCDQGGGCKILIISTGKVNFRGDRSEAWCTNQGNNPNKETLWCADADPTPCPCLTYPSSRDRVETIELVVASMAWRSTLRGPARFEKVLMGC